MGGYAAAGELKPGAYAFGGLIGPQGVVLPAPAISQGLCLSHRGKQHGVQEFIPEPAVVDAVERSSEDSAKPCCHGDPGSM